MPTMKRECHPIFRPFVKAIKTIRHFYLTPVDNPFFKQEQHPLPPPTPRAQHSANPDSNLITPRNSRTSSTRAYYDQPYPPWAKKK